MAWSIHATLIHQGDLHLWLLEVFVAMAVRLPSTWVFCRIIKTLVFAMQNDAIHTSKCHRLQGVGECCIYAMALLGLKGRTRLKQHTWHDEVEIGKPRQRNICRGIQNTVNFSHELDSSPHCMTRSGHNAI